ncbi:cation:proton antiporter [Amycolatopsis sp. NPDC059090]|uniref:cation:proton antiporter n=1 Tax=unclassified Amycolatopsis TaxID=2618356 RepID=UPI00366B19FA
MNLFAMAVVLLAGLAGPLLATPKRARIPIVVGEILLGVAVGRTGLGWVKADDPILSYVASAGFALVMLVAGSHVPLRDSALRVAAGRGALLAALVGVLSVPAGFGVAALVGTGHGLLYAVLLASSSAALVMPVLDETKLATPPALALIVQVAIADTACIVALPLAAAPQKAGRAALGALAVIAAGAVWFVVLRWLHARGLVDKAHDLSKSRHFGLELRIALIVLFGLAGLAQLVGVSVMLAGFVAGLALAAVGEPRRLARQLFGVTDGFLGPVFFVWLGASLDLRALGQHPVMLVLAALIAAGSVVVHGATRLLGQPLPLAVLAGAQLGVPVAAVTIGTREQLLAPGEGGAILAAALISVAVTAWAASRAVKERTDESREAS